MAQFFDWLNGTAFSYSLILSEDTEPDYLSYQQITERRNKNIVPVPPAVPPKNKNP